MEVKMGIIIIQRVSGIVAYIFLVGLIFLGSPELSADEITKPNISGYFGASVNSYTGNLFYQRTDLVIQGRGLSLDITFYYNSGRTQNDWGYGNGWSFNYSMQYYFDSTSLIIERPDGQMHEFTWNGTFYDPPVGVYDSITEYQTGKYILISKYGKKYYFEDSVHKQITKIEDRNGNTIILDYNNGLISTITDPSGRLLNLIWTSGHLTQITDPNPTTDRVLTYEYDASGNMIQMTNPDGITIVYGYGNWANMTSITDALSNIVNILYNLNKAVSAISCPEANTILSIEYDSVNISTSVNRGELWPGTNLMVYSFDSNKRLSNIQFSDGCFNTYTWDSNNNILTFTNKNSYTTYYTYDNRGNSLTETDPAGNVLTYTYNSTYNFVTSITDKNGNTTSYSYDSNGNMTSVLDQLGNSEIYTYDTFGNILTETDKNGNTHTYTYDINGNKLSDVGEFWYLKSYTYDGVGNLLTFVNPNGNTTAYNYDILNNLISKTNALGDSIWFTYDDNNNLILEIDENGITIGASTYDALQRRVIIFGALGNTNSQTYDEVGNVVSKTDANGNVSVYTYDCCNLVTKTDALGNSESYTYDPVGNRISLTDKNGNTTSYSYDPLNRLISKTDPLLNTITYSYDAEGNIISETDVNGNTTSYLYDGLDRLISSTDALGNIESYTYDSVGNIISETDKNGSSTIYSYDAMNRLISITDPFSSTSIYSYDPDGNMISETDPNDFTSAYSYDVLDRLIGETDAYSNTSIYSYDQVGNIIIETDKNGNSSFYSYDVLDRLISETDALSNISTYSYDPVGNLINSIDRNGNVTVYTYDCLGRLITETDPLLYITSYSYDPVGNLVSETDANSNITTYSYDPLNRLIARTDALLNSTAFSYNPIGSLINKTDANGNVVTYSYDALNRLTTTTDALTNVSTYSYDSVGNLLSEIDNNGDTSNYSYDDLNRLILETFADGTSNNYLYDSNGNITQLISNNNTVDNATSYVCDSLNRIITKQINYGNFTRSITYSYDNVGNELSTTSQSGTILKTYDMLNRVVNIIDQDAGETNFIYDSNGNRTSETYPNLDISNYVYDANNRLASLTTNNQWNIVQSFNYTYDVVGNKVSEMRLDSTIINYNYDAVYNLLSETNTTTGDSLSYAYDNVGRRVSKNVNGLVEEYTYNSNNQLLIAGSESFIYDNNSNRIQKVNAFTADSTYYSYSKNNQLQEFLSSGGDTTLFSYSPNGMKLMEVNNSITKYFMSHNYYGLVEEYSDTGVVSHFYNPGISINNGFINAYYHTNGFGSTTLLSSEFGEILAGADFDYFGIPDYFGFWMNDRIIFNCMESNLDIGLYNSGLGNYYDPITSTTLGYPGNEVGEEGWNCSLLEWDPNHNSLVGVVSARGPDIMSGFHEPTVTVIYGALTFLHNAPSRVGCSGRGLVMNYLQLDQPVPTGYGDLVFTINSKISPKEKPPRKKVIPKKKPSKKKVGHKKNYYYVQTKRSNVYSVGDALMGDLLKTITYNETVDVLDDDEDECWWKVRLADGTIGWILQSDLIEDKRPVIQGRVAEGKAATDEEIGAGIKG